MHYFPFRYTNNLTLYTKDTRAGQSDWELEDNPNKKTDQGEITLRDKYTFCPKDK